MRDRSRAVNSEDHRVLPHVSFTAAASAHETRESGLHGRAINLIRGLGNRAGPPTDHLGGDDAEIASRRSCAREGARHSGQHVDGGRIRLLIVALAAPGARPTTDQASKISPARDYAR